MRQPYRKVSAALSCCLEPIHCEQIAEMEDSILDGTRKKNPMIFSTTPTACR